MKRLIPVFCLLLALAHNPALALGIGEPRLESYLGEAINIKVPLTLSARQSLDLDRSSFTLADRELFNRFNVPYERYLTEFHIRLDNSGHEPFIHIYTRRPFMEPVIDLLLDIQVGNSRIIREVTVLIDPRPAPAKSSVDTAPVQTPAAQPRTTSSATGSQISAVSGTQQTVNTTAPQAQKTTTYGPVRRNQTLSDIARDIGYGDATVYQVLLALWQANPEAFLHNNMNALREGSILDVPDRKSITATGRSQAKREVLRQYQEWTQRNKRSSQLATAPASKTEKAGKTAADKAEQKTSSTKKPAEIQRRLSIIKRGDIESAPPALRQEIKSLNTVIDEMDVINNDLRSRITTLEKQVYIMTRRLQREAAIAQTEASAEPASPFVEPQAAASGSPSAQAAETEPAEQAQGNMTDAGDDTLYKTVLFTFILSGILIAGWWLYSRYREWKRSQAYFSRP